MNIVRQIVPDHIASKVTFGGINKKKYITIHQTGNTAVGANAQAHANLQSRGNSRAASWHYQVDDKVAIQSFEDDAQCWHASDGKGDGNLNSIAIEICINLDGNYKKSVENGAKLTKYLMDKYNIPIENVKQHYDWYPKNCPAQIRAGKEGITWAKFLDMVKGSPVKKTEELLRVQLGAFGNKNNADNLLSKAKKHWKDAFMIKEDGLYKVQIGAFKNEENARKLEREAKEKGFDVYIAGAVAESPSNNSKEEKQETKPSAPKSNTYEGKGVRSIYNGLINYRNKPTWNAKDVVGTIQKGYGFPYILEKIKVGNSYQFKVQNSRGLTFYITAHPAYVKVVDSSTFSSVSSKSKPKSAPKTLKVGSEVKVKKGATDYDGKSLASFVYDRTFDVIQISGNRVVIGQGKTVTAAIHKNNLIIQ